MYTKDPSKKSIYSRLNTAVVNLLFHCFELQVSEEGVQYQHGAKLGAEFVLKVADDMSLDHWFEVQNQRLAKKAGRELKEDLCNAVCFPTKDNVLEIKTACEKLNAALAELDSQVMADINERVGPLEREMYPKGYSE